MATLAEFIGNVEVDQEQVECYVKVHVNEINIYRLSLNLWMHAFAFYYVRLTFLRTAPANCYYNGREIVFYIIKQFFVMCFSWTAKTDPVKRRTALNIV